MPEEQERPLAGPDVEWFASSQDGGEQGPLPQATIETMLKSGRLTPNDLVWNTQMTDWKRVRDVPQLAALATATGPTPPGRPRQPGSASFPPLTAATLMAPLAIFSRPQFFRAFGRVAALLAVLVFLVSLFFVHERRTWFDGVLMLALMFFLGEAVGTILERLDRLDGGQAKDEASSETTGDG